MGVHTYENEEISSIPPARLYKSFILDADKLIPQVLPEAVKSYEILEGNGGVGTIKVITFSEKGHFKRMKHRVDEVDEKNFVFKYTVIEGDILGDDIEYISNVIKIEVGHNGGSVIKIKSTYHTKKDDGHHGIKEKFEEGKEKAKGILKAVEAHLHAHPHAYT